MIQRRFKHNNFYSLIDPMAENTLQNVTTSTNNPQYEYRSSQILGLPVNSRLISDSNPNIYTNNYQSFNPALSPHRLYNYQDPNAVRVSQAAIPSYSVAPSSIGVANLGGISYQNTVSPGGAYRVQSVAPQLATGYEQSSYMQGSNQRAGQVVRSRLVPVTQYVPVYEVEGEAPQQQTIHQRVILHEPQAFKEREYFEEKLEAGPTLVEEERIEEQPSQLVNTKIVRVSQDPLVETVQGGWRSKVSASKVSYSAPPPVPREEKSCCSGWLLLLLGLIALGGILTAIFVGKNSHVTPSDQQAASATVGTKVSSVLPSNIREVSPLTNAVFEVRGKTAVAAPVSVAPKAAVSVAPSLTYVAPTDISIVAKTSTDVQDTYVPPQQMSLVSVAPVVVHPDSSAQPTPATVTSTLTKVSSTPNSVQPTTVSPQTVPATTVAPHVTSPTMVSPQSVPASSVSPQAIPATAVSPTTATTTTTFTPPPVYPSQFNWNSPVYDNTTSSTDTPAVTVPATGANSIPAMEVENDGDQE